MHPSRPLILIVALVAFVAPIPLVASSLRHSSSSSKSFNSPTSSATAYFTLCNSATDNVCICELQPANSPISHPHHPLCSQFIDVDQLPLVKLKLRRVNLTALLHTNETYESYLKRRIASIISKYCEQQANECPETTLRLQKENVILLNVTTHRNDGATTIGFAITRRKNLRLLNRSLIFDAVKIKYILSAQVPSLSRVLGGVRIDRIYTDMQSRMVTSNDNLAKTTINDNINLYIILGAIGNFLLITYIIAAVKICREYFDKKQRKRSAKSAFKVSNDRPNDYGSCRNDINSPISSVSASKRSPAVRHVSLAIESDATDISSPRIKFTNRMFQCDHSQLPAENSTLTETLTEQHTTDEKADGEVSATIANLQTEPINSRSEAAASDEIEFKLASPAETKSELVPSTDIYVVRSKTADVFHRSSSESDDERVDVYYQLAEADSQVNISRSKSRSLDSFIENSNLKPCENEQNYGYMYEKLQESNSSSSNVSSGNLSLNEDFSPQKISHIPHSQSQTKIFINHSKTGE